MRSFWQRISHQQPLSQIELLQGPPKVDHGRMDEGPNPGPLGEWASLANRGLSPFDPEFASVSGVLAPSPQELPVLIKNFPEPYLPIEALRDGHLGGSLFCGKQVIRQFRSSGTTASSRSVSRYSSSGLKAYRWASLYTFRFVLMRVLELAPESVKGYSLIPPVAAWPDSSLAQMVAWIAEVSPLSYIQEEFFSNIFSDTYDVNAQPVWLFATAFHLVDLIDRGHARPLPPGSVIIETGGTKGKTRSVTRDQLYSMVERALGVPSQKIISEYGMCELASQAYDFVDPREHQDVSSRSFRFPSWVQLSAMTAMEKPASIGQGALLVADPMRIDHPWPLRTEDLVLLEKRAGDQAFQLLGRLDRAPLKGCSLLAETPPLLGRDKEDSLDQSQGECGADWDTVAVSTHSLGLEEDPKLAKRADALLEAMGRWRGELAPLQALKTELGSENAAKAAIEDIYKSLPADSQALVFAAGRARGREVRQRWMFILPRSHSLVGLYPVVMGYILGFDMKIRISGGLDHETSFVRQFLKLIQTLPEARISIVPSSFRLRDGQSLSEVDAVLAYGEDETLDQIAQLAGKVPVRGFGGRIGISILSAAHYAEEVHLVVRDALTLGQRGCMATRLLIVHDEPGILGVENVAAPLVEATREFWQGTVPWQVTAALDAELFRYKRLGFDRLRHAEEQSWPLVVVKKTQLASGKELGGPETFAQMPMTIPVVLVQGCSWTDFLGALSTQLNRWPPLASCSMSPRSFKEPLAFRGLSHFVRPLGEANAPAWDGTHEGFPLFDGPVVS